MTHYSNPVEIYPASKYFLGTNAQYVVLLDSNGSQVSSFGGGTQYTEGETDDTITGQALLAESPSDTLNTLQLDSSKNLKVVVNTSLPTGTNLLGSTFVPNTLTIIGSVYNNKGTVSLDVGTNIIGSVVLVPNGTQTVAGTVSINPGSVQLQPSTSSIGTVGINSGTNIIGSTYVHNPLTITAIPTGGNTIGSVTTIPSGTQTISGSVYAANGSVALIPGTASIGTVGLNSGANVIGSTFVHNTVNIAALPTGANTIGSIIAVPTGTQAVSGTVTANPGTGQGKTLQFGIIDQTSAGTTQLVAGVAGSKVKMVSYSFNMGAAGSAKFIGIGSLTGTVIMAANTPLTAIGLPSAHLFETTAGSALSLVTVTGLARGHFSYIVEP